MKKQIRQGQTRWRLWVECGPDGRADRVYVLQCLVMIVGSDQVAFRDDRIGFGMFSISQRQWRQFFLTRRIAMRAAQAMVRETDRDRDAEYTSAWLREGAPC